MKPSIGRIVHYRQAGAGPCLAAIVTKVHATGNVNLTVFDEDGDTDARHGIDEAPVDQPIPSGGQWHWPERVQED